MARAVPQEDAGELRALLQEHLQRTGSARAAAILADWEPALAGFRQVVPVAVVQPPAPVEEPVSEESVTDPT
jgi:glutamate synthase domain-containing protein 3